jgi:uncharacterized protein
MMIASASATGQAQATGPSFDCEKAGNAGEKLICGDRVLSAQDNLLALVYRDVLSLDPHHADTTKKDQLAWLRDRNRSCGASAAQVPDYAIGCLRSVYSARIDALYHRMMDTIAQRLVQDQAATIAVLQSLQSPEAKQVAQMLSHATTDDDKTFTAFTYDLDERFARENHEDIHPGPENLVLPCSLVERIPRLLLTMRAYFGSTLDLILPNTDCKPQAAPAVTSKFLLDNPYTRQNWLQRCRGEGTIFYGYERDIDLRELRLVHFPRSYLTPQLASLDAPEEPWPEAEDMEGADWTGDPNFKPAKDALVRLYRQQFRLSAPDAERAAMRALWDSRNKSGDPNMCLGDN